MAKRITAIVSLSIIGILIIATLIMANVDVNHKINCANPDSIYVQYSSNSPIDINPNDENYVDIYNGILDRINNASKESSLTALFSGTLSDKPSIVTNSTTSATSVPSTSDFYVSFVYNNPQKLMDGNNEYKNADGDSVYYKELVFSVSSTDDMQEVRVYIIPYYSSDNPDNGYNTNNSYYRYYLLNANFSELYNYLVDNGLNN